MRARVIDRDSNCYYVSEVYGVMNSGGDYYVVGKWHDGRMELRLVPYLNSASGRGVHPVNLECISSDVSSGIRTDVKTDVNTDVNPPAFPWIYKGKEELAEVNRTLRERWKLAPVSYFRGYEFLWNREEWLVRLMAEGRLTDPEAVNMASGIDTRIKGWHYVESETDIEDLMEQFSGFHDSVIREVHYISGDHVEGETMYFTEARDKHVQVIFDSGWAGSLEVVFEAFRTFHLSSPGENYMADLYDASVFIRNHEVYFYDSYQKQIPAQYDGTWVHAMGMRWRVSGSQTERNEQPIYGTK